MTAFRTEFTRRLQALRRGDDGSALILALLIVLLVGALLAAVLNYQGTGFGLVSQMTYDRNEANYLQGAVEGAINNIRGSSDAGSAGKSCPTFSPPTPSGLSGVSSRTFQVTCTPQTSPLVGGANDAPPYAILTVGTAAGEGISVTGNNPLFVNGPIFSNGAVTVDNQPGNLLRVNGSLNAQGPCTGNILTTDAAGRHCNPAAYNLSDPQYTAPIADQGALDSLISSSSNDDLYADPKPACTATTTTFSPGFYGTRPDTLASTFGCSTSLWIFSPGTYVFDYSGDWHVFGYQVIGGTLVAGHTAHDGLGSACTSANGGVQFDFQGSGTMSTQSSSGSVVSGIELCGPSTSSGTPPQRIVLYGNTAHNTPNTTQSSAGSPLFVAPSSVPSASGNSGSSAGWTLPAEAQTIDGVSALTSSATTGFTQNKTAILTYSSMANTVPKGANVTAVKLEVVQSLTNATSSVTFTSTLSPVRLTPFTVAATSNCTNASPCDITSALTSSSSDVLWRVLRSLSVAYTAKATNDTGQTTSPHAASVDGLGLLVSYTVPTFRQQSSSGTFFGSTNNPNVFMHGTVDTPEAGWAVNVHNTGTSIFNRGVIVRTLAVKASASSKQSTSPFQLPQGDAAGRYVWFRGYVDGTEKLRACVLYHDSAPSSLGPTAYFGYATDVRHWLFMRTPSAQSSSC